MAHWIDTHCHLDAPEFDTDRAAVHDAACKAGVVQVVIPAIEVGNFGAVRDCCLRFRGCLPAYGIHPLYVHRATESDLKTLRHWVACERPVAVGEIGLDAFVSGNDMARQEHFFTAQLRIARDFDLPVLLHVRRAVDKILRHVKDLGIRGGIAHAFNGSRQQAEEFLRYGFKLGFGGAMTFEGSRRIRELAQNLPLEAIVLETDSPDIAPAWLDGARNTPDQLPRMASLLAELRGISTDEVARASRMAAMQVLNCTGESSQTC